MDKITYLLGAGASNEALPLAKEFAGALLRFSDVLDEAIVRTYGPPAGPYPEEYRLWPRGPFAKELVESFQWLGKEAQRNDGVDIYAKILFRPPVTIHIERVLKTVLPV